MRRGEILALRWRDDDLRAGAPSVRQSPEQTKAGLAFKQPKMQKGRRSIAPPPSTAEVPKRHKTAQGRERWDLRDAYHDQGLVCAQADGRAWEPDSFSRAFGGLARRVGLPTARFHDLGHAHATQLMRQGVPAKVVSERLGHATVGITLDTCSHVLPGMQDEAARRVDAALRAALRQ